MESKQVVGKGYVKYVDEDGWEDEAIEYKTFNPLKPEKKHPKKKYVTLFPGNHFKNILINQYIGVEVYLNASKQTRYILLKDATKEFKRRLLIIYGSQGNYLRAWVKRRYGISWTEYQKELCKQRGFESEYEYKKFLINRLGFESYSKYQNDLVKKNGFKNRTEYEKSLWKKNGFKSQYEYEVFRAKRAGFKSVHERRKHWKNLNHIG